MNIKKGEWEVIRLGGLVKQIQFLKEDPPLDRGKFAYDHRGKLTCWDPVDMQCPGTVSRYNYPKYKDLFYTVKDIVEKIIHEKLYPTYYYDRFYFKGSELVRHTDRPSCEISVSLNISSNTDYDWPIWYELGNGQQHELVTKPGDGVLYKGCVLPHWREPLKGNKDTYYHQIFFHYVRRDGPYLHYAYDANPNTFSD